MTNQTIQSAAYGLCRLIRDSPDRPKAKEILHRLLWQKTGDNPGMHSVGYLGRKESLQFFGYLSVDARREELNGYDPLFQI